MPAARQNSIERPRRWWDSARLCFVILLLALACYRFSLIGQGSFFWGDERCFVPAESLVEDWQNGEYVSGVSRLFESRGRPGFVLISVIPAAMQQALDAIRGADPESPARYDVAPAFNVLVSLGITACLFALACLWVGSRWYALLIALVYSLLVNANMWVRHLVPYNESLLLFLAALLIISIAHCRKSRSVHPAFWAGALSAFGYMTYPGHYAFVVVVGVTAMACSPRHFLSAAVFAGASAMVVAIVEFLARLGGTSYIQNALSLSGGITMGWFGEGYVFAWRYLRDVEGVIGIILFALFLCFVVFVLWRRKITIPRTARVAITAALVCYLFHASMGVLFEKMVFYGRILLMYLPLLVIGAVLAVKHVPLQNPRRIGIGILAFASAWSFATFARSYARINYPSEFLRSALTEQDWPRAYPPHVLWDLPADGQVAPVDHLGPDFATVTDTRPDGSDVYVHLESHADAAAGNARFIGVNLKWMFYVRERYDHFSPPEGYDLVAEAAHPNAFPAVGYEGHRPWERRRLRERQYMMRLYERRTYGDELAGEWRDVGAGPESGVGS